MAPLIRAARSAQHLAVRALAAHGGAHPLTLAFLAAASTAAARAWDAGHPVTDIHPRERNYPRMGDDLHTRYMAAAQTWAAHRKTCSNCQHDTPCKIGAPLYERFSRLQDAHLNRYRSP
ncbi:hypothetical protein ABZ604_32815 [Streptomyces sp. NPDC012473]|uniref:hypothetical protein n=1 Tax=Streptomyces sp. NPDC012473 TaxID=3156676 RepID=UPI0033D375CE